MTHVGDIHEKTTMFFRQHVGEAVIDNGSYEMSTNMGGQLPIIRSKTTGKWFTISWQELIELAVKKGIDKP